MYKRQAVEGSTSFFQLNSGEQFSAYFGAIDANVKYYVLPSDNFAPYLYAGAGAFTQLSEPDDSNLQKDTFFKVQYGGGLEFRPSTKFSIRVTGEHNLSFSDNVEGLSNGRRKDHYLTFGVGLNYNFDF